MIRVEYCENGFAVPDFGVESKYQILLKLQKRNPEYLWADEFSTAPIFNRIRVGIVEGDLTKEDVEFVFEGKILSMNDYARIDGWPNGFLDLGISFCERLLTAQSKMYKERK